MVRTERLELSHLAAPEPKSGVSTNSTTSADGLGDTNDFPAGEQPLSNKSVTGVITDAVQTTQWLPPAAVAGHKQSPESGDNPDQ